ncbi:MAG: dihydrolipoyl dehydrogenase [Solirubrobacterales bacterium]|nr:dihydrolipoyl dehydrogenase [Solirubrobacterales bacterium]MCB8971568.1 dihydrolipoyl dehydrogenase [Thermoleophilales bacterium]MCO5327044.1 dihydrolipoyl dehydrogenase [Solirubrobacterales bacterium]
MADTYDVIVIGTGPGGYVAAIRAAQLGLKTAVVERDDVVGGRCLNYACIPAKTLLRAAELLDEAKNGAEQGVIAKDVSIDFPKLHERRESVRKTLTGGVAGLFKKNKIDLIEGEGSLTEGGDVKVGDTVYETKNVILATGSVALPIPGTEFGDRVLDTWGAWSLPELPKSIAVVGAGASGSEIASAYIRFGAEVKLIEMLDQILPAEDKDVVRVVERTFKKQGIEVLTGAKVEDVTPGDGSVKFKAGGADHEVDYLIIAGGRGPDVEALNLEAAGVKIGDNGKIDVDGGQQTSTESIYAIGDITPGPALAHKAMEEGIVAAEKIAGQKVHAIDLDSIAGATFCHPQVASVGLTEAQAKEAGHEIKTSKFKLGGVGAGAVYDDRDGMVKLVVDSKYGEILGAHIVGNRACDMIAELVAVKDLEGGYQELTRIIHPHPTISEAIPEAARAVDGWATHA